MPTLQSTDLCHFITSVFYSWFFACYLLVFSFFWSPSCLSPSRSCCLLLFLDPILDLMVFFHLPSILTTTQQLFVAHLKFRMDKIRHYFHQRNKHEIPLGHQGMRQD